MRQKRKYGKCSFVLKFRKTEDTEFRRQNFRSQKTQNSEGGRHRIQKYEWCTGVCAPVWVGITGRNTAAASGQPLARLGVHNTQRTCYAVQSRSSRANTGAHHITELARYRTSRRGTFWIRTRRPSPVHTSRNTACEALRSCLQTDMQD